MMYRKGEINDDKIKEISLGLFLLPFNIFNQIA